LLSPNHVNTWDPIVRSLKVTSLLELLLLAATPRVGSPKMIGALVGLPVREAVAF